MECAAVREFTGVHNMIRGLLRLMDSALLKATPDDSKQMKVLSDFGTFAVAGAHFHHTSEDDYYWPAVERNGADPSLLEPLIHEHHVIDPLLDEMKRAFEALGGWAGRYPNDRISKSAGQAVQRRHAVSPRP